MRKNRSRNSRGEFITITFLIKIIIAVIAIFVVMAFGAKIWNAIFPSGDKNAVKSFDSLYSLMNSKQQTNLPYDSSTLSLYLPDNHRIFLFSKSDSIKCGTKTIYRPTKCEAGKNCLCLYKNDPDFGDKDDRDNELVKCLTFNTPFINGEFQINQGDDCELPSSKPFFTVIVAVLQQQNNQKQMHVWLNTEDMQAVDKELKKPICPQNNKIKACALIKDGTYTTKKFYYNSPGDFGYKDMDMNDKFNAYDETFNGCNQKKEPSIIAKCNYEPISKECEVECEDPQIECGVTYTKCEDFNEKPTGSQTKGYIQYNTYNHFLCTDNGRICGPAIQCFGLTSEHYNCKPGKEDECKKFIDGSLYDGFNIVSACNMKLGPYSQLNPNKGLINPATVDIYEYGDIIDFYDTPVTDTVRGKSYICKNEVETYFRQSKVLSCRSDRDCLAFILNPPEEIEEMIDKCEMEITTHHGIIMVYDYKNDYNCNNKISEYFSDVMRCSADDVKRFAKHNILPP